MVPLISLFSQGCSHTVPAERDRSTVGYQCIAWLLYPSHPFLPLTLIRPPGDPDPEQGNRYHNDAQVSLRSRLLRSYITRDLSTALETPVLCRPATAPLSSIQPWGSIQSTAGIHPICKQKMVWHWCPKKCSWMPFKQINNKSSREDWGAIFYEPNLVKGF